MAVLLKVYGHIYPASDTLKSMLDHALETAICDEISYDIPLISREKDMLKISFEGIFFPLDEVLVALNSNLTKEQKGKLDVLELDIWKMTRYTIADGTITKRTASLNQVLDYSGF